MILILGGTTEGRKAVAVCDEAGKAYYYSTRGHGQQIESSQAILLTGVMDSESLLSFCREKGIRLLIDAAHPFAGELRRNIEMVSRELQIPVVRYERIYPERDSSFRWFDSYGEMMHALETAGLDRVLALTGVQTIPRLKPYWSKHTCWFRILRREESLALAKREGFPSEALFYYPEEPSVAEETAFFKQLAPEAILTKESGDSGGFNEKAAAAKALRIPLWVVKRPPFPSSFFPVYGNHGLRKAIEKRLPGFFPLRTGYTTGTCATAAAKAALLSLLTGEIREDMTIALPDGEWVTLPIESTEIGDNQVCCSVRKDAGDDPDVTNGHEICATVRLTSSHTGVRFLRGVGVGLVTLPGLGLEIGGPAINQTPREMIGNELRGVCEEYQKEHPERSLPDGIDVTLSVPDGEALALKTFNPKLGVTGGISILGTSGIVRPFSTEAFIESIRRELEVAKALGCEPVVLNSGAKSERFLRQLYPNLPPQAFIHYGNFIGDSLRHANELGFRSVVLGIMIGKAVKLAEGALDTHSKKVEMNRDFLLQLARIAGCADATVRGIQGLTMARQLWDVIPPSEGFFFQILVEKCRRTCAPLLPKGKLLLFLLDEAGNIRS